MNDQHFLIAGFLMLLPSGVLLYYYFRSRQLLDEMWAVKTYEAAELKGLCEGGFDATVEVQGVVSCDKPLTSFATGVPCCWFHIKVRREAEKSSLADVVADQRTVGPDANWVTDMDRCYSAVFKVEDKTGYTLVDPEGADIESITAFDGIVTRAQPWFEHLVSGNSGRYHVTEEVFMPTGYAYVLGKATSAGDHVLIHCPDKGYISPGKPFFVISRKTEQELNNYRGITVHVCLFFGIPALFASALFILQGLGLARVF